jgi:hypothetical protein
MKVLNLSYNVLVLLTSSTFPCRVPVMLTLVNKTMNLRVPKNFGKFLDRRATSGVFNSTIFLFRVVIILFALSYSILKPK